MSRTTEGSFNDLVEQYEARSGGHTRALARHFLQLPAAEGITAEDAVVLDNACGTAIVTDEIIRLSRQSGLETIPKIHAVDVAPNMVKMATAKLQSLGVGDKAIAATMPGEALAFPEETFTHSITNCGILFFKDSKAGAHEIYRTLKPGGTAIVTSWRKFDFFGTVVIPAQKAVRPDDEPFPRPMKQPWYDPEFVKSVMKEAGFEDVVLEEKVVTYGATGEEGVVEMLVSQLEFFVKDAWTSEEKRMFKAEVGRLVTMFVEKRELVDGLEGVGFPAKGIIAVCRK
ncbi:methyltransferase type 11 [Sarocladium strictum]